MPDTLLGGIAINEFLVDPNSATNNYDTDGNGVARGRDEFLELVNTSNAAIDISGLELWDQGRDNWFTFPPGTILQAGAVAVVVRDVQSGGSLPTVTGNNLAFDANFGSNVFNNGGDNIVVYDPANDEYIQATYNGDPQLDPTTASGFSGFSSSATRSGSGEDFGNDIDGISLQRLATGFTNSDVPTPGSLICFVNGTFIETDAGFRPVETLRARDLVRTLDAGLQPVAWVFETVVTQAQLDSDDRLRPVTLPALPGFPPLQVSRQHRLMVSGKIVQRMFGTTDVLIPAKDILTDGPAAPEAGTELRYIHVLLDGHYILNANGYAAESLFPGSEARTTLFVSAVSALPTHAKARVAGLLNTSVPPARPLVSGAKARRLSHRHRKNGKPLVTRFRDAMTPQRIVETKTSNRQAWAWSNAQQATSRQMLLGCTST
ncbi:Hint domain-containing protein [Marivita sp. S6314]|uniref:Hint domain-containing protein n=1 Tax=Marivita sp. S6314 TaxID=2926406 RepID=UPI001FF36A03|nr:Hint domain-containing protein [Marivita sp. S6314]MCK0148858.1 Hint domain-containing protein [Marivita sp. S6314]